MGTKVYVDNPSRGVTYQNDWRSQRDLNSCLLREREKQGYLSTFSKYAQLGDFINFPNDRGDLEPKTTLFLIATNLNKLGPWAPVGHQIGVSRGLSKTLDSKILSPLSTHSNDNLRPSLGGHMDTIELQISKWEKFNPRKDIKNPTWFALSNRILENADLFDFSAEEFKAWIYILCQASQINSDTVKLNFRHASRVCGIKKQILESTISKLEKAESLRARTQSERARTQSVHECDATDRQTDNTDRQTNNNAHLEKFADFYFGYPRKVGKTNAQKLWVKEIRSGVDPDLIIRARDNYVNYLKENKTESRFILHASTFMGRWQDWDSNESGDSKDFSGDDAMSEFMRRMREKELRGEL